MRILRARCVQAVLRRGTTEYRDWSGCVNQTGRSRLRATSPPGMMGVMPKRGASEKVWLKSLKDRLDWLNRNLPTLVLFGTKDAATKEVRQRVAQIHEAIAAKRFDAILLYHELENWYRELDRQFELRDRAEVEWVLESEDSRKRKAARNSAQVRSAKSDQKRADCLAYVDQRLREDPSISDAQLNEHARLKFGVHVHTVRRWRREDVARKIKEMNERESGAL